MIRTGLVSVTFRELLPAEIIDLVKQAALQGIEWGGDIHVPPGQINHANDVAKMTAEANLSVVAYGSYYSVGGGDENGFPFETVLETAQALRAPTVRVWAGNRGSQAADSAWWSTVIEDARQIADLAAQAGIRIAFEYHDSTLTDTAESASRLLREIGRDNVSSYWQAPINSSVSMRLQGLRAIAPYLSNVHVFNCVDYSERKSLREGLEEWSAYMQVVKNLPGDRFCLIEFVKDNARRQFLEDAEVLNLICR